MSRKLGALVLALGILVVAMEIKTVLTAKVTGPPTMTANGPAPAPPPRYPKKVALLN